MMLLHALCSSLIIGQALSCMGKKKVWKAETGPVVHTDIVSEVFGTGVTVVPYDSAAFDSYNYESSAAQLGKCTFDRSCCWKNSKPPFDSFEWNVISGVVNPAVFGAHFVSGGTSLPDSNFLAVVSEMSSSVNAAQFYSCSIPCSKTNIVLSLRYWMTRAVRLQACSREAFSESEDAVLSNCQELSPTAASQIVKVEFPVMAEQKIIEVVIVADGFVEPVGAAVIDDLQISYTPCDEKEESTGLVDNGECGRAACSFEKGNLCAYNVLSSTSVSSEWAAVQGRYRNPNTGIHGAGQGQYYAATYLKPGQTSSLVSEADFPESRTVRFLYYEATHGVQLKACCGDMHCTSSNLGISASDRQWRPAEVVCPAGRQTIKFTATNNGKNEGAVALDSVGIYSGQGSAASIIC